MSPFFAVFLVLLLGSSSYAAGRLHGQLSYRVGYRFGYRQGYFDGDRGAWNRRRRDAQAAIASVLGGPPAATPENMAAMENSGVLAPAGHEPGLPHRSDPTYPPDPTGGPDRIGLPGAGARSNVIGMGNVSVVPGVPMGVSGPPTGLSGPGPGAGTTYTGASFGGTATNGGRHSTDVLTGGNA